MKFILRPIVVHRRRATNNNNWDLLTLFRWLWQQSSGFYYGFDNTCDGFCRLLYGFFRANFIRYGVVVFFTLSMELADYFNVFNFYFTTINFVLILNSFLRENLRSFTRVDFSIICQIEIVIHPELNCHSIIFAK